MEGQAPTLHHSRRMENKLPLPPEETCGHHQKHKKTQTTKLGTLRTTSGPPPEIDPLESSFPLSYEPEITSTLANESDKIKTKVPEPSLLEVIEPDFIESDTLFPKVIQPEVPHSSSPVNSEPSSSLPWS